MSKLKKFLLIFTVFLFIFIAFVPEKGLADAGNFAGDSDWGDSDWGDSDWGSDYDSDWSWSSSSDDDDWISSSGGIPIACLGMDPTGLLVLLIIAYFVVKAMRKNKKKNTASSRYNPNTEPDNSMNADDIAKLKEKDPNFNEQRFLEKISNNYVQLQDAWEAKDLTPMRSVMTDSLYNQFARQLEELKQRGYTNYVDKIAVLNASILGYTTEGENDVIFVRLDTRICDYTVNDDTNEIVSGDRNRELFMGYEWKLIRSMNMKTPETEDLSSVNCPNCGAPLSVNQSSQCEYCGTVVSLSEYDWALSQVKGLYQRGGN